MLPWLVHLTLVEPYCASHRMAGSSQPLSAVVDIAVTALRLLLLLLLLQPIGVVMVRDGLTSQGGSLACLPITCLWPGGNRTVFKPLHHNISKLANGDVWICVCKSCCMLCYVCSSLDADVGTASGWDIFHCTRYVHTLARCTRMFRGIMVLWYCYFACHTACRIKRDPMGNPIG